MGMQIRKWGMLLVICSLFFCISFETAECQAVQTKEYFIILDDTLAYPLTEQQHEQLMRMWDTAKGEEMMDFLRSIFGADKVPSWVRKIQTRTFTYTKEKSALKEEQIQADVWNQIPGIVDNSNPDFDVVSGRLMSYHGNDEIVTIPNSVTTIFQGAFSKNQNIKKIIVPDSVKNIDCYAFYQCENLSYIVFAGNTQIVDNSMISRCESLTSIVAPEGSKESRFAEKKGLRVFRNDRPTFGQRTMRQIKGSTDRLTLYNNVDPIRWRSSKKSIVSVSSSGKIKCRRKGSAKIIATVNGKEYPLTVRVEEKSMDERITQIIRATIKKGMSTREKIKAVHDWMIQNVKYDYENYKKGNVPEISHTAKGALLRGIAVCDGYSEAFQKIMNRLGIPCQVIIGEADGGGHAWNKVKIGRKWRYIDVTFDDPIVNNQNTNTKPYYTYFLKTASQMRKDHLW